MEAIPKLPMISFDLKVSTEPSSFGNLKRVSGVNRLLAFCYENEKFFFFIYNPDN